MKNISIPFSCILLLALLLCGMPTMAADRLPAFPGAEGFGRYATGGRGGQVYHVTTLTDGDQPGTLRHAIAKKVHVPWCST